MRARRIAVIAGLILSFGSFIPEAALAQNSVKPIGKVLTIQGSVTVEHDPREQSLLHQLER